MVWRTDTEWKHCALGKLKNERVRVHANENITNERFPLSFLDHSFENCTLDILYYVDARKAVF
jgi:hypothetical protein